MNRTGISLTLIAILLFCVFMVIEGVTHWGEWTYYIENLILIVGGLGIMGFVIYQRLRNG